MSRQWRGVVGEYGQYLDPAVTRTVLTLGEGGTPLVPAPRLGKLVGCEVFLKVEGQNPTGSFKDRGMTTAMAAAVDRGMKAVVCASTGNTSASAAAYAARAGLRCAVLVPDGKIAMGKLSQAIMYGAVLLQVKAGFDECLVLAQELAEQYPVELVNSVNPARIEGQQTAAFEVIDALGQAPDLHCLPVGNAGNITAYWRGYQRFEQEGRATSLPTMWGFQAAGAAPLVHGEPVRNPETVATAIRIGNPASWQGAIAAKDQSGGMIDAVSDEQILQAQRWLATHEGVFVEPASAAGVAGLFQAHARGEVDKGQCIVITVTGNGLKDPQWGLIDAHGHEVTPTKIDADAGQAAHHLGVDAWV